MFFSIVVPTYNRAPLIKETLLSILTQTNRSFEIIVVDDGSTDNTEDVVKSINSPQIAYYKIVNSERGYARNYGAKKAIGDYVNFFDSDDIALPNHIEIAERAINQFNHPEIFHLNYAWVNPAGKIIKEMKVNSEIANNQLLYGNILSCNGVFIKREIAIQFPFNESRELSVSEDWDLWLRLSSRFTIYMIPTITSHIVDHEERSVAQFNEERINKRKIALLRSLERDVVFTSKYPRAVKIIEAHMNSYLALHAVLAGHKAKSVNYLFLALRQNIGEFFKRRSLAIIKHLIFSW